MSTDLLVAGLAQQDNKKRQENDNKKPQQNKFKKIRQTPKTNKKNKKPYQTKKFKLNFS